MKLNISKHCANSLRTFSHKEIQFKLKSAHAHELVAAFLGYKTKVSLLAEEKYPLSGLEKVDIIVMPPDSFVDKRRSKLSGLDPELPSNDILGDHIYQIISQLCNEGVYNCARGPFRSYEQLAKFIIENSSAYQSIDSSRMFNLDIPRHRYVTYEDKDNRLILTVYDAYEKDNGEIEANGKIMITLPRIAGRIGFQDPKIDVEKWSAGARRSIKSLGIQP